MFKRKKKTQQEENSIESLNVETEAVDIEKVASEVAEEIVVYEAADKNENKSVVPDSPTVRIPNLKGLSEDLIVQEAKELLAEYAQQEDDSDADKPEIATEIDKPEAISEIADDVVTPENTHESAPKQEAIEETTESPVEEVVETEEVSEPMTGKTDSESETTTKSASDQEPKKDKKKTTLPKQKKKSTFLRKKEFKQRTSFVANLAMWVFSCILFVFCLSNLYQQILNKEEAVGFFNTGNAIVVSESMVPVLEKNDFIVYKSTPIEKLQPEDIVVYKRGTEEEYILIVHRLVAITDGYAITKGDNNAIQDDPFEAENIVGKVIITVPQLGVILDSLASVKGLVVLLFIFILIAATQFLYRKAAYNMWLKQLASNEDERKAIQVFLEM